MNYIDLFAGAGGLSEGFIRAGFKPLAHVEYDEAACFTLRTRNAYHWLNNNNKEVYKNYLNGIITRQELYDKVPEYCYRSVIHSEINSENISKIFDDVDELVNNNKIDLIIGGPPCQAYSLVGRSRDENNMQGDKRNYLYTYYADFLEKYKPKYFVFENVLGLLSAKDEYGTRYLDLMLELFKQKGYQVEYNVLNASNFGIPQSRKRIILVGYRGKKKQFYPMPQKESLDNVTINQVFEDLPELQAGQGCIYSSKIKKFKDDILKDLKIKDDIYPVTYHQARSHSKRDLEIYTLAVKLWNDKKERLKYDCVPKDLQTHNNLTSFLDRFKVVVGDSSVAHTVVAHISKDGHHYIHPDIKQNRSLTPREAARLQTFPDNYFFESASGKPARTSAYKQIGNAVPVLLAEKIAKKLKENW